MLLATSRWVKPPGRALVRSTSMCELRLVEGLLDAQVDEAGNLPELRSAAGSRTARLPRDVGADDLDVDGRGQPEVQDLADDVGRQEVERDAGELASADAGAARGRSPSVGLMLLRQRDQDVGVGRRRSAPSCCRPG